MPTISLHAQPISNPTPLANPLPEILHTPSGLALLEIQGTLNLPEREDKDTDVGHFVFEEGEKKVWLYVGKHQRLAGSMVKLRTPLGVVRRRDKAEVREGEGNERDEGAGEGGERGSKWDGEELEIAEIVRWKIVFSGRPEPVS